jgi:hypothetical protein
MANLDGRRFGDSLAGSLLFRLGEPPTAIQGNATARTRSCSGMPNALTDRVVVDQGLTCPVDADRTKQAMLNRVPLRRTGRIVSHRDAQTCLVRDAFDHFDDVDGNFLQQFQTDAYEARLFELFLATLFRHEGFVRDTTHHRPDFVLKSVSGAELCVEAVTANPSEGAPRAVEPPRGEDFETLFKRLVQEAVAQNTALARAAAQDEFRTRLARLLTKKLDKRYWELPKVSGKPLILAVQDFHAEGSLLLMSEPFASFV